MPNLFIEVPSGGDIGNASASMLAMAPKKTIFVSDDLNGTLYLEAQGHNSGGWVPLARIDSGQRVIQVDFLCQFMRLNAERSSWTGESPPEVHVSAEQAAGAAVAVALPQPYEEGDLIGDNINTSTWGAEKTLYCTGLTQGCSVYVEGIVAGIPEVVARFDGPNPDYKRITGVYSFMRFRKTDAAAEAEVTCVQQAGVAAAADKVLITGVADQDSNYEWDDMYFIGDAVVPGVLMPPGTLKKVQYVLQADVMIPAGGVKVRCNKGDFADPYQTQVFEISLGQIDAGSPFIFTVNENDMSGNTWVSNQTMVLRIVGAPSGQTHLHATCAAEYQLT